MNFKVSLDFNRWRSALIGGIALLVMTGLYLLQIAWPGKLTSAEAATAAANSRLSAVIQDPLNWPYKLLDFAWLQTPLRHTVSARLAAVCLVLLTAVVFYFLAKRWHGRVTAAYTVLIFATSTWLLQSGRSGVGQIMLVLVPLVLLLVASWLNTTDNHNRALVLFALASSLALLTPGAVWLLVVAIVLLGKVVTDHIKGASAATKIVAGGIVAATAGILAYACIQDPGLIRTWLGLPAVFDTPLTMLKQWLGSIAYLTVRGPDMSGGWLAHTPVLDVATTGLLVFGVFLYRKHLQSLRTRLLLAFFLVGSILVALNGSVALGYVIGIAYLVAATGLAYFQHKWFKIFPLNPIARGLATALIVLLVTAVVTFHTQRYFVAWQRSPATQYIFRAPSTKHSDLIQ